MSCKGVVANLEETPSSYEQALGRETSGAAETMSDPTIDDISSFDAKNLSPPVSVFRIDDCLISVDAILFFKLFFMQARN